MNVGIAQFYEKVMEKFTEAISAEKIADVRDL